ncbi:MAG: autoinducer binding domain-containing protein [Pseudomonadales bacterium]
MLSWAENVLNASANAETEQELFDEVLRTARAIGFDYCAYGMRLAFPVSRAKFFLINNYSPQWCDRYAEMQYVEQDPTVIHGARSSVPLVWSDEVFAATPQLWDEAQMSGLRVGWAQASPMRNGVAGMLSVARSAEPLTASELAENDLRLRWLSSVAHMGFTRLVDARSIVCPEVELTDREKEVLKWSAGGKTITDISEILLISVDTVKFHTRNVLEKLNVANRTAAVARAAYLGLLD